MLPSMDTPTHQQTLRTPEDHEVQALLEAQAESGMSLAAFARERGVSNWKLYKAKRAAKPRGAATFDPVTIVADQASGQSVAESSAQLFALELGPGLVLRIPPDFDELALRRVVDALVAC